MKRKRLTQVFPFLLPIRKWQRKKTVLFRNADRRKQIRKINLKSEALLPNTVFEQTSFLMNENKGWFWNVKLNNKDNHSHTSRNNQ